MTAIVRNVPGGPATALGEQAAISAEAVGLRMMELCAGKSAKEIARALDIGVRTAFGYKRGNPPAPQTVAKVAARWGLPALQYLFQDALDNHAETASLLARAEAIEAMAHQLKKELAREEAEKNRAAMAAARACSSGRVARPARSAVKKALSVGGLCLCLGLAFAGTAQAVMLDNAELLRPRPPVVRLIRGARGSRREGI